MLVTLSLFGGGEISLLASSVFLVRTFKDDSGEYTAVLYDRKPSGEYETCYVTESPSAVASRVNDALRP